MTEHDDVETDLDWLEELVDHAKIEMVKPTAQSRAKTRNSLRRFFLNFRAYCLN